MLGKSRRPGATSGTTGAGKGRSSRLPSRGAGQELASASLADAPPAPPVSAATAPHADVDRMLAQLRTAGLKMTPQRIAIVRQIAADESHPSAQELFERLKPTSPSMSFATVYNTLAALCDAGLAVSLSLAPGSTRFDPNMRPHDHTVCDRCGAVRDVMAEPPAPPAGLASRGRHSIASHQHQPPSGPAPTVVAAGFEVRSVERIFRGLCLDCARQSGAAPSTEGDGLPASHHP